MTNGEKYKTAEERFAAFMGYCDRHRKKFNGCTIGNCPLRTTSKRACQFLWLSLEAEEEKPLPCPCCGGEARSYADLLTCACGSYGYRVRCTVCGMASRVFESMEVAIAAWNRRVK